MYCSVEILAVQHCSAQYLAIQHLSSGLGIPAIGSVNHQMCLCVVSQRGQSGAQSVLRSAIFGHFDTLGAPLL